MSFLEKFKNYFAPAKEVPASATKQTEEVLRISAPMFHEIPPDNKAGKYITEGMRSWAAIAISAVADEILSVPLKLYRKSKENWVEVENDAVVDFIDKPNPAQTKEEFLWLTTVFLLAEGEAPWFLNSDKNPTQMVLLNPERIKPKLSRDTGEVTEYEYIQSNGTRKPIPSDFIIFLKIPNTETPFRGSGVMSYIKQTLDIDNYIEEHLRMFFFNNAMPGGVLETDQSLDYNIIQRLRNQFEKRHKGVKNSHRVAVLSDGLKFKETTFKLTELQMTETNNWVRDKVLAAFKVPKSILGITEDVNRANGENSDRVFARRAVKPKLKLIEAQLNQFLLPKFSGTKELWFEFDNPVQEDEKLKAEINDIYVKNGVLTVGEVREELGLLPLGNQPKQEPKKEEPKKHASAKINDIFVEVVKDLMDDGIKKEFTEEEKEKYHQDKIIFSDRIEAEYQEKLQTNFQRQGKEIIKQVNKELKKDISDINFNEEKEAEIMAEISVPFLEEVILQQANLTQILLGLSPDFDFDETVRNFIKEKTAKLGKSTAETTANGIKNILEQWAEDKETITELKKRLKDYFFGNAKRAEAIARTEVSRGAGFATLEVYKRTQVVGKKWATARDERVCQFCAPMDGKILPVDKNFFDRGDEMAGKDGGKLFFDYESIKSYPLHVQCRCDLLPVFNEGELKGYDEFRELNEKLVGELKIKEEKETLEAKEKSLDAKEKELEADIKEFENLKKYE